MQKHNTYWEHLELPPGEHPLYAALYAVFLWNAHTFKNQTRIDPIAYEILVEWRMIHLNFGDERFKRIFLH